MKDLNSFYKGKKVLIVGGNGYLGSNLIAKLTDIDCEIIILDRIQGNFSQKSSVASINEYISDIKVPDIWDTITENVNQIFYFAGQTSVYVADNDPIADFAVNVQPIINLLETCRIRQRNPDILFSSTVTVYGLQDKVPVNETFQENPLSAYDLHKLIAETYLKYYSRRYLIPSVVLRLANVYGPGPVSTSADRGILNMMIKRALNREDLTIFGQGNFLRDYIYIDDVINAFLTSAMSMDSVSGNSFIVGSGVGNTVYEAFAEVIKTVKELTSLNVNLKVIDPPQNLSPIESRNFIADFGSLNSYTGWRPQVSLKSGIEKTIKFYNNIEYIH